MDRPDNALDVGLDLVHQLHRLEDAERLSGSDRLAFLHERFCAGLRRAVERADHRRLDAHDPVRRRGNRFELRLVLCGERRCGGRGNEVAVLRAAHGDTHARFLDRDLPDPRLLDDAHELANPLCARLIDSTADERLVA